MTIKPEDCVVGNLYLIRSRNLAYVVCVATGQWTRFTGIREKFSARYLDTETMPGTVRVIEEDFGPIPRRIGLDTGWIQPFIRDEEDEESPETYFVQNKPLFDFLNDYEKENPYD